LGEDEAQVLKSTDTLRNFFSVLKSIDGQLRFAFLTGVSKIGKLGIFSGLNNLKDISADEQFATLCGYTQAEFESNFPSELDACVQKFGIGRQALLDAVKQWYNGYSWDGTSKLYNPFSILNFLDAKRFANFWFETGTPTFLVKLVKRDFLMPHELEALRTADAGLESTDLLSVSPVALLFQTGYLTIGDISGPFDRRHYTLGFPNREVRESFFNHLMAAYMGSSSGIVNTTIAVKMSDALEAGDLEAFFLVVKSVLASVPYPLFRTREDYFHALMHVMLVLTDMRVQAEEPTNTGRIDQVLDTGSHIYVFEYKLDQPAQEALAHIKANGYAKSTALLANPPYRSASVSAPKTGTSLSGW
jgi:hypothetical protein